MSVFGVSGSRVSEVNLLALTAIVVLVASTLGVAHGARHQDATGTVNRSRPTFAAPVSGPADPSGRLPRPRRLAVLVLENRSYEQVIGNDAAPFLNRLARRGALATRYFALGHPSLPNYVALTGGSSDGILKNCAGCDTEQPNLLNQLDTAQIAWRAYFEGLARHGVLTRRTLRYDPHYNPFAYYERVADSREALERIQGFAQLDRDLARGRLPAFSWIAPDVLHDGHDSSLEQADRFAARLVPRVLGALGPRGVLYVLWDEGPNSDHRGSGLQAGGGRIPLIAAGGLAPRGARFGVPANHYALLRTIEANLGVPALRNASLPSTPLLTGLLRQR